MKNLNPSESYLLQKEIISGKLTKYEIIEIFRSMENICLNINNFKDIVRATREAMIEIDLGIEAIDNCGTGGDKLSTFNISTVSAFVISAAGIPVAKHGNRSASGKCGSADVLEELGVKIAMNSTDVIESINETNFAFLFAPIFHPALINVKEARKEYGKPTYFNYLGPLLNPAKVKYQVVGVFDETIQKFMADTLIQTGSKAVAIIRGENGMDELSISGPSMVIEATPKNKEEYLVIPEKLNLKSYNLSEIQGGNRKQNAEIFMNILQNKATPAQFAVVILNAAMAIKIYGKAGDLSEGIQIAEETILSGKAFKSFERFRKYTNKF
jgi:anthranilate phosphoribosyltransferase